MPPQTRKEVPQWRRLIERNSRREWEYPFSETSFMISRWTLIALLAAVSSYVTPAGAHFLFLRIVATPDQQRRVEVYFSEQATAGDPQYIEKIAHTRLWVQNRPGEFTPLTVTKAEDRLRAGLPDQPATSISGFCEYGVLTRNVPFLLRYYPKAVTGDLALINRFKPRAQSQFEIVPTFSTDQVTLRALHRGKAVKNIAFTTINDDLMNEEIKADGTGRAVWKPQQPGHYCVYARMTLDEPGEVGGKSYTEIREFATLAFAWPIPQAIEPHTPSTDASDPTKMMANYLKDKAIAASDRRQAEYEKLKTPEELAAWQQTRKAFFTQAVGGFPARTPLNAQVVGSLEHEGLRVEKILFESQPQHYVTGVLYLPATAPPYPAAIVPCGHSANGKAAEPYQRISILLAKNGIAAFCYDPIGQGERLQLLSPDGKPQYGSTTEHTLVGVGSILLGANTARYRIWDGMRAIDYLQSRDDIDGQRIGCTGNSGGGTLTSYLMALDERIACAAPSCYLTTLRRLVETIGPQDAEQNIHGQLAFGMDHADYVLMRAPRPTLMCVATRDYFDIAGAWHTFREAKRFYTRQGFPERVDLAETDATHGFSTQLRVAAVRWMRRWLLDKHDPITEPEFAVLSDAQLQCTSTGQVMLLPGARSVVDINIDWESRLRRERASAWKKEPATALEKVRRLAGVPPLDQLPQPSLRWHENVTRQGFTRQRLMMQTEPGIDLAGALYMPDEVSGEAVLYCDGRGKDTASCLAAIEQLAASGHPVLAVDLRGFGETAPATKITDTTELIGADSKEVFLAYLLGKSYIGMRASDVLIAARYLRARFHDEGKGVRLIAYGDAGPAALHAAALEPQLFAAVRLERSLTSWSEVVGTPTAKHMLPQVGHAALQHYDLPDLTGTLPKEKVSLVEPLSVKDEAGAVKPQASGKPGG